jgi:diadenosine tetraphosphate (Ap4A) HIT family hydrolase
MTACTHNQLPRDPLNLPAFGLIEAERVLAVNALFAVVSDKFPISLGHTLIIPRRPVVHFRELDKAERADLLDWVEWTQNHLSLHLAPKPDAFNLGVNDGKDAGQTMTQFHFHVIPRYSGDVADPRGGLRWILPAKAKYW